MKVNQISSVQNYTNNYSVSKMNKNNAITFEAGASGMKKAMLTAPLVLAALGFTTNLNAQEIQDNDSTFVSTQVIVDDVVNPLPNMGAYFKEHGFTPEQRAVIADYAEEYASKNIKSFNNACNEIYENSPIFAQMNIDDFPANPLALNSDYHMGKIQNMAKALTEFRGEMISAGAIRNGSHYTPNPEVNPLKDCREEVESILGKGITYEQYKEENAETIKKLNNLDMSIYQNLTESEINVFNNMAKIYSIYHKYVNNKYDEYTTEASKGIEDKNAAYKNDMDSLQVFRDEADNTKNTFVTYSDSSVSPTFEYWATSEGFTQAVVKEYVEILINQQEQATDVNEVNEKTTKLGKNGIYDLSGKKLSHAIKGLNIINGQKVFIK